ncbi:hypothetical protein AKJ16_DCAP26512 [Drosera capensis]
MFGPVGGCIALSSGHLISSHMSSFFTLFTSVFFFPFCPSASELACVVFLSSVHPLLPSHPSPHGINRTFHSIWS